MTPTRTVLRYGGGKWKLAPWIISHFPHHKVYVEPFAGSAAVLLQKKRAIQEVYNDMDGEIVNVFRVLRNPDMAEKLRELLMLTPYARSEFEASFAHADCHIEQARRTIVKSFMGYSSATITSPYKSGFKRVRGGVSPPASSWFNYPQSIELFTRRLRSITIESIPAQEIIPFYDDEDTLFYVDPPYVFETRNTSGKMYRYEMTNKEHIDLATTLQSAKGKVIISGYPSELYKELYHGWSCVSIPCKSLDNSDRLECLWISPRVDMNTLRRNMHRQNIKYEQISLM